MGTRRDFSKAMFGSSTNGEKPHNNLRRGPSRAYRTLSVRPGDSRRSQRRDLVTVESGPDPRWESLVTTRSTSVFQPLLRAR